MRPSASCMRAAPTETSGLQQINVFVPANAPTGPSVPIVLTTDGVSTQGGATVAVQSRLNSRPGRLRMQIEIKAEVSESVVKLQLPVIHPIVDLRPEPRYRDPHAEERLAVDTHIHGIPAPKGLQYPS